ncbi:probable methyltransferase-like protein 24 [Argopecten irradians]|uniref:probable methyltransferase-like protein 24 n=1 Tax=Argopecten irradians TaxID=31199 RepID=UPI0037108067
MNYLRRILMRNRPLYRPRVWLLLLAVLISAMFLLRRTGSEHTVNIVIPLLNPLATPFNRTWWDAKSYPDGIHLPRCHGQVPQKHNVSLIASLKKSLGVPDGPPPDKDELCSMSFGEVEMYYHTYLSAIQNVCRRSIRMGNTKDGGWDVCSTEIKQPDDSCLVYSFGIQFDFSFDDAISTVFGCEVHSFDPSMHQKDHLHKANVHFHATGLSDYNGVSNDMASWKMRTLVEIRKELNHVDRNIDVIKMDIESWEWNVIPDILKTSQLAGVKQFLVEFHANTDVLWKEYWIHKLLILRDLYLEGYRVFWIGRNNMCTYKSPVFNRVLYACYEVSFVKI